MLPPSHHLQHRSLPTLRLLLALVVTTGGCEQQTPTTPAPAPPVVAMNKPSEWQPREGSSIVAVRDESADESLQAAIKQARAEAPAARERWQVSDPADRERWSVKWAARTVDQSIEHVWVRPVNWSPFRVEGVLATSPITELECGKSSGELVSFPIEELTDWMRDTGRTDAEGHAVIEGGYTTKALTDRFGQP
jgi:uncharacterized protein YegJ (DUF2314 family)